MIRAVLFDLDNTLIANPPERFTMSYVQRLIPFLHSRFPELAIDTLRNATRTSILSTIGDQNPLTLNRSVFLGQFSALTGIAAETILPVIKEFFRDIYPELQPLVRPREASLKLVRWLLDRNYAVAVATNPLFFHEPTLTRMSWGGLTHEAYPVWFVSTLDNMHFTKPNPQYYEEILTRIGFEPDQTLMVGDDWQNDMVPAFQAGLNTYWNYPDEMQPERLPDMSETQPNGHGTMSALWRLVSEENWLETLKPLPLSYRQIIPRLQGNLAALVGMVGETPAHVWHQRPDPNEWTPMEVIVHLRDREALVQRARLERILREDNPFLVPPETPPAPGTQELLGLDPIEVTLQFAADRQITLGLLENLTPAEWMRPARHSVFGPTSLLEMAAFTAHHDRLHINQLCQTIGKCD